MLADKPALPVHGAAAGAGSAASAAAASDAAAVVPSGPLPLDAVVSSIEAVLDGDCADKEHVFQDILRCVGVFYCAVWGWGWEDGRRCRVCGSRRAV